MPTAIRPVGHEDRLSLVEHLTELRSRLLTSAVILAISFSFCFWQNNAILKIINHPLGSTQNLNGKKKSNDPLEQSARFQIALGHALKVTAPAVAETRTAIEALSRSQKLSAADRRALRAPLRDLQRSVQSIKTASDAVPTNRKRLPITLGPAEPFTTTINVALYAAILLALPFLLYQLYAFILPAFSPTERRVALPLMMMVPALFAAGCVFGYFVVLPRGLHFLQNFNDDSFDILLQAKDYYRFSILLIGGIGLLFQIPVGVLAITRVGGVTVKQLRKNRGYVILAIAILAAVVTPTPDPVTMGVAMGPLLILYELSILLAAWLNRVRPSELARADEDDDLLSEEPEEEDPDAV